MAPIWSAVLMHMLGLTAARGLLVTKDLGEEAPSEAPATHSECRIPVPVVPNDSCDYIAERCGIALDNLMRINGGSAFCQTLEAGQSVCCSAEPPIDERIKRTEQGPACETLEDLKPKDIQPDFAIYCIVQALSKVLDDSVSQLLDFEYRYVEIDDVSSPPQTHAWMLLDRGGFAYQHPTPHKALKSAVINFRDLSDKLNKALHRMPTNGCDTHARNLVASTSVPVLMLRQAMVAYQDSRWESTDSFKPEDFFRLMMLTLPMARHDKLIDSITDANTEQIMGTCRAFLLPQNYQRHQGRNEREIYDLLHKRRRAIWGVFGLLLEENSLSKPQKTKEIAKLRAKLDNSDINMIGKIAEGANIAIQELMEKACGDTAKPDEAPSEPEE